MQYGKSEIIDRLKEGKELGYTDLENTSSCILADVVLAFDTILWGKTKGKAYTEALKQVGESLESYWEGEEEDNEEEEDWVFEARFTRKPRKKIDEKEE